ncbi:hypothetical protein [Streptomyces sp. V1I1]|uniref:hypothetical protein n=1 Tax=Streptomyces sp. V1I1 TaxID=3042272 RepID=UPI0027D7FE35|nr:hypothetical protein [Streptomyces sp. V1I1]
MNAVVSDLRRWDDREMSRRTDPVAQWGRCLFEQQKGPVRWAADVLDAASAILGKTPEIEAALVLAGDRDQWMHGRAVFELIRGRGLDKDKPLTAREHLLFRLAELVGKLAHNTAGPPPFFDYHAGWQVGSIAHRLAIDVQDPVLCDRLVAALGGWPRISPATA